MLESIKSSKKTIGVRQSLKAVENGLAGTVYIAKDADEKVVRNIKDMCLSNQVQVVYIDSMKQLGKACGIEVGAAVACILK
ncbi:MAG: ribosomal L7Ae/L30e/S12e/Gadd45 family protein [Bacillota bacterium]|nr:ribosomal L7Ae/L30e/S12e/Gadd45 family protein [Bacillota bacterium]